MSQKLLADASPEKRLFVSLITRDIPLIAAFLDLVDNSINSAVEKYADRLRSAKGYLSVFNDDNIIPDVEITLSVDKNRVSIADTASGISAQTAKEHVFKFGRSSDETHEADRLSVYGIGLKRALFKLGNQITMRSEHVDGGFDLELNVSKWEKDNSVPWTFEITAREPVKASETGTKITVTQLYDNTSRRIIDGAFLGELRNEIARTYPYFISKFVTILLDGDEIQGIDLEVGSNHTTKQFLVNGVDCAITAGIGVPKSGGFKDQSSGWFVFCNGRAVVFSDKSTLTGWGGAGLPIFQPKHRPFLGTVFFVSDNPENLPWTTTKSGINVDSAIWQEAKREMVTVAREVIRFLDRRYSDEGTEVASSDLIKAAGKKTNILSAVVPTRKSFSAPRVPENKTVRIQHDEKSTDIKKIAEYLKKPGMGAAQVGRHTFHHFLKNEVGED